MKKIFLTMAFVASSVALFAQMELNYSFREFNRVHYNPATVGSSTYGNISLIGRHQYLKEEDQSQRAMLNIDGAFGNSGMGASIFYNESGDFLKQIAEVTLSYAYHIPIAERHTLSLGIGAGVKACRESKQYDILPTINFGFEYRLKGWTFGGAIDNIDRYFTQPSKTTMPTVCYNLYTNYQFEVGRYWNITPSVAGYYDGIRAYEELGLMFEYTKAFWFGATYRMYNLFLAESVIPTIGFNITEFMRLGYAWEYNLSGEHTGKYGTHELYLTFRFRTRSRSNDVPRFTEWDD